MTSILISRLIMYLFLLFKKMYWHFFKVMPGEMTFKTFWNRKQT